MTETENLHVALMQSGELVSPDSVALHPGYGTAQDVSHSSDPAASRHCLGDKSVANLLASAKPGVNHDDTQTQRIRQVYRC